MSNIQLTVDAICAMQPLDIVKNEAVRERFIQIYNALWGGGEAAYEKESTYFNSLLRDDEKKQKATKFSIFTAFIDLAICGLSLEPGVRALCYLQGRNYKIGEYIGNDGKKKGQYEGRLVLTVSGYGELVLRARNGQIQYADNPVLVYDEDEFSFSDKNGCKQVSYTCHLPHVSNHIVACYMRITRADGSIDYGIMLEEDWLRLQEYSAKNNRRWDDQAKKWTEIPNELYMQRNGMIDTGFLIAKCIKHAFKTYPKVRVGRGTELESQQPDTPQDEDLYGVEDATQPAMPQPQPSFANSQDMSAGVTVDPSENNIPNDEAF